MDVDMTGPQLRQGELEAVKRLVLEARVRLDLGDPSGAMAAALSAHQLRPDQPGPAAEIGRLLSRARLHEEALGHLDDLVRRFPDFPLAWTERGYALALAGRDPDAEPCFQRALDLAPGRARPLSGLGETLEALGRYEEALEAHAEVARRVPDAPLPLFMTSLIHLRLGRLAEGFAGYEHRFQTEPRRYASLDRARRWHGEDVAGKRIFVAAEQGFGDLFQMLRFVAALKARGAITLVEARDQVLPLLASLPYVDAAVPRGSEPPPYDLTIPSMSLPFAFGVRAGTRLWHGPYVPTVPAARGPRPAIGLSWRGSRTNQMDRRRSIPLEALRPVLAVPGVEFVSLHPDLGPDEAALLAACGVTRTLRPEASFAETRALLSALDLVVSVDTSIVHLAGAMGRRALVLLCLSPDWRWGIGRTDSDWYPSLTLIRQRTYGDWAPVIADAAARVRALADAGRSAA